MRLGIMQPYFFPYLGYFDLIRYSNKWIFFDTVQFIRHGWINRNRILHPKGGWQFISAPMCKHSRATAIKDIRISENSEWRERILGQVQHYHKKAPFFRPVCDLLQESLNVQEHSVSRFNARVIERVCCYLGFHFEYEFFSDMDLRIGPVDGPGDWALRISEALGSAEYVNPPGGEQLFDRTKFRSSGILLTIRHLPAFEYSCNGYDFVPDLSIIDVLMWNEPGTVLDFLDRAQAGNTVLSDRKMIIDSEGPS